MNQPIRSDKLRTSLTALVVTVGLAAGLGGTDVCADEMDWSMFSLRGFGSLGVTHSSENRADFPGNFFQPDGAGYSKSWAYSVDSKVGVQLDARVNDRVSAVLQVVSQYGYDGSYRPQVEWGYIDYKFTPDFTLRLGRIVTASFMESETRLIGYTFPWLRPPQELYGLNPSTNKDGVDIRYRFSAGETTNTLQLSYGTTGKKFPGHGEGEGDNAFDIQHLLEYGHTTFRIGYLSMDLTISAPGLDALFDGLEQFGNRVPGPAGQQALRNENQFRIHDTQYTIKTLGISHRPGDWLFMAEWAQTDVDRPTFFGDVSAWYATVGYRFGPLTPYVTAARLKPDRLDTPDIPVSGLPPELAQNAAMLNAGLEGIVSAFAFEQKSLAAGVRWDVADNIDLKFEFQHLRTGQGSSGRLANVQPGFRSGGSANIFSVVMDFVF